PWASPSPPMPKHATSNGTRATAAAPSHATPASPGSPGDDPLHPPCGPTYTAASRHLPDRRYEITGIPTWDLSWTVTGGPQSGASGTITPTPQSQTTLRINELQVLVTNP